jgi:dimethylhistidine N-methyltransferase
MAEPDFSFYDLHPPASGFQGEVIEGLSRPQKRLSPKFFYDARGSKLFDAITALPEYYPTRTEIGIIRDFGATMVERVGRGSQLIELGSGSSVKIRLLLDALEPSVYMPIDISRDHLADSAAALAEDFPSLDIHAVCADYSAPVPLPEVEPEARKTAFFPGSSVGNFDPEEARALLRRVATMVGPRGGLLIGVDLKKDEAILNAAYNDCQGITAEFNLNLLVRINRELGADFDLDAFYHHAFYNAAAGRVEMHLVSETGQAVRVDGYRFRFSAGESIHTECSYKYRIEEFQQLARTAGFVPVDVWVDGNDLFSVHYLEVA